MYISTNSRLSDFPFTFHFHALEKEMATHSSILAWRIPGTGKPGGLPSMGSHGIGHDWSDLAAAAWCVCVCVCVFIRAQLRPCWAKIYTRDISLNRHYLFECCLFSIFSSFSSRINPYWVKDYDRIFNPFTPLVS